MIKFLTQSAKPMVSFEGFKEKLSNNQKLLFMKKLAIESIYLRFCNASCEVLYSTSNIRL